jgi:UPF0288 family protein (methanogenesis marker protein 3)
MATMSIQFVRSSVEMTPRPEGTFRVHFTYVDGTEIAIDLDQTQAIKLNADLTAWLAQMARSER